jgi:hypothetical protein
MKKKQLLLTIVLTALLLTACGGGQETPSNTTGNGQEGDQISVIYTQAAQTLAAEIALTEAARPAATNTPMSSPTPVILATNTPLGVQASPTPFPTLPPLASPTPFPTQSSSGDIAGRPCLRAEFLFESPKDGWVLEPGQSFTKEWRFGNSGSCTWFGDFRLVLTDGTNFGDATIYNFIDISDITDIGVPNSNRLIIRMSFQAPDVPGHYTGYYMLADPTGKLFGIGDLGAERFWVDIIVRQ